MNLRQEYLLKTFIRSSKGMSLIEMENLLHVANRTLREDIKSIQLFLSSIKKQIHYNSKEKVYYLLSEEKKMIQQLYVQYEETSDWLPREASQRELFLLLYLIENNHKYVTAEEIAEQIFFSKTVVNQDVRRVSKWMETVVQLEIELSKSYGIKIDLKEDEVRLMISSAIQRFYYTDSKYCMIIFGYFTHEIGKKVVFNQVFSLFSIYFYQKNSLFDHESFITFILEVIFFSYRISKKNILEYEMKENNQMLFSDFPFEDLGKITDVKFPENERNFFYLLLSKRRSLTTKTGQTISETTRQITEDYLNLLTKKEQNLTIHLSESLLNSWQAHLERRIYKHQLYFQHNENSMVQVEHAYHVLLPIAKKIGPIVKKYTGQEFNQMDYLYQAMYLELMVVDSKKSLNVAIVSNYSKIVIDKSIAQLSSIFKYQLIFKAILPINYLSAATMDGIDFILSTDTIRQEVAVPIEYFSFPLNDKDIEHIQESINQFFLNH